jgi:hypothetical protein
MKNILLLSLFALLSPITFAQDVIVKLSGEEIAAKVEEITLQEILYKHPDSLAGPTLKLSKAEVFMIRFANGTREVFQENLPENQARQEPVLTPDQMFLKGEQDARITYNGSAALWGSAASSLVFPYGLVGAVVIGAVPPKVRPDRVPDISLLNDPNYVKGYQKQAHRRKVGNAVAGAGIGTVTVLAVAMIVLLSAWN